jgi:hypothetical protein
MRGFSRGGLIMPNPDPYRDYDPDRAKYLGWWFGISLGMLLLVSGLIYFAGHSNNVASNSPAGKSEPTTTGSAPASR